MKCICTLSIAAVVSMHVMSKRCQHVGASNRSAQNQSCGLPSDGLGTGTLCNHLENVCKRFQEHATAGQENSHIRMDEFSILGRLCQGNAEFKHHRRNFKKLYHSSECGLFRFLACFVFWGSCSTSAVRL